MPSEVLRVLRKRSIRATLAVFALFALVLTLSEGAAFGDGTCPTPLPKVDKAYKIVLDRDGKSATRIDAGAGVELGDTLLLEGDKIDTFVACARQDKPVVLFLNGQAISDIKPEVSQTSDGTHGGNVGTFTFRLTRGDIAQSKWTSILGSPRFGLVYLPISLGLDGGATLDSDARIALRVLPQPWFDIWLLVFLVLLGLFVWLCGWSNILRGEGTPEGSARPAYSLSRAQGAWWFFVIIAAYLLIGIVTGDFANSINATALILLAIGSATALASAAVDASKNASTKEQDARQDAAETSSALVETKASAVQDLRSALATAPQDQQKQAELNQTQKELTRAKEVQDILRNASRGFWTDILSDANGISFHRFQNVAWTLILSVVFARGVYHDLAMPNFDPTLLGLMGLSAATFVGLKIPEATVPTRQPG